MYVLKISPIAQEDLIRTKKYLSSESGMDGANKTIKNIVGCLEKFQTYPLMGRSLTNLIEVPTDYMYFVVDKNYVFYRVEEHTVRIIRILSTRQDYMSILFGDRDFNQK